MVNRTALQPIEFIPVDKLALHRLEPRKVREPEHIQEILESIKKNGFDHSRALKVVPENGHFAIFAGGTRYSAILELNKEAEESEKLLEIPCWVYNDLKDFDLVRLATEDNDLNSLARPVSITRVWCEYHSLTTEQPSPNPNKATKGKYWSQLEIAEAKNISQGKVSERLKFYRCLPRGYWSKVGIEEEVRKAFNEGEPLKKCLTEEHLKHIYANYLSTDNFEAWLTEKRVWSELLEGAIEQIKKSGRKSVRAIRQDGDSIRETIAKAEEVYEGLPLELREQFIQVLAKRKARSVVAVKECESNLLNNLPDVKESKETLQQAVNEMLASLPHDLEQDFLECAEGAKSFEDLEICRTRVLEAEGEAATGDHCLSTSHGEKAEETPLNSEEFSGTLDEKPSANLRQVKGLENENPNPNSAEGSNNKPKEATKQLTLEQKTKIFNNYRLGNFKEVIEECKHSGVLKPKSIKLICCDPPYGKDYQSNRRYQSAKLSKIEGDADLINAQEALGSMLELTNNLMLDNSHLLVKSSLKSFCWMQDLIEAYNWKIQEPVVWSKIGHGAGNVISSFAPCCELVIHATRGNALVRPRIRALVETTNKKETNHPMETHFSLWQQLIESTTLFGDLILDCFAGTGSVPIAAQTLNRQWFAVEINEGYREEGIQRILDLQEAL